jgi:3-hydroxyisobutyrate dehydrogenase-like beta-hydroxyacid dehydrogenase
VALGDNGIKAGNRVRTVIDLSTTGPGVATIVAKGLDERQIVLIDSPVSGGIAGAKAGTLAVMVSGPRDVYDAKVAPILKHFGKLFYTGDKPGLAQTAKLVNNLLAAAALVISSEGMAMGVKAGLDPKVLLDIINVSSARRRISFRDQCCWASSTLASRPLYPTRTSGSASTKPKRWACR